MGKAQHLAAGKVRRPATRRTVTTVEGPPGWEVTRDLWATLPPGSPL